MIKNMMLARLSSHGGVAQELDDPQDNMFLQTLSCLAMPLQYSQILRQQDSQYKLADLDNAVFEYFEMLARTEEDFGVKLRTYGEKANIPQELFYAHALKINQLSKDMGASPIALLMVRTNKFDATLIPNHNCELNF